MPTPPTRTPHECIYLTSNQCRHISFSIQHVWPIPVTERVLLSRSLLWDLARSYIVNEIQSWCPVIVKSSSVLKLHKDLSCVHAHTRYLGPCNSHAECGKWHLLEWRNRDKCGEWVCCSPQNQPGWKFLHVINISWCNKPDETEIVHICLCLCGLENWTVHLGLVFWPYKPVRSEFL